MADKSLLELPLATTGAGALIYGVQDNVDKAFPASVLQGSESPQPANTVYAGPTAPPGNFPTFRPLVPNDIPDLSSLYMSSTGGSMSNATLNNSTILGGTISGATAVFDEDKFTLRDTTDTTRNGRFNVALPTTGTSVTWTLPGTTSTIVGRDTADTLTNKKIVLDASTTATAALRVTPGQPPSAPINGDLWTTNAGLFAQINNTTVGPFAAAASSTVNSWNGRVGAVTMGGSDVTAALGYVPYNPAQGLYLPLAGGTMTGSLLSSGLIDTTGSFYAGGGSNKNRIRVTNPDGTNLVRIDAVNSAGNQFAKMGLYASSYESVGGRWDHRGMFSSQGATVVATGSESSVDMLSASIGGRDIRFANTSTSSFGVYDLTSSRWVMQVSNNDSTTFRGSVIAQGGFGPGSDPRLKEEQSLTIVDNAVHVLYNLNVRKGKYHDWYNPDGKDRYFVMADKDMNHYAPEVILLDSVEHDGVKFNGWSSDQMIALLVKSVQELKDEIDNLKEKLNEYSN